MHEQVRDATPADAARVDELLAAALGDGRAFEGEDQADAPHVLVGQLDDVVVGIALVSVDATGPALCGLVRLVYVEPDAREVGVGGLLLEGSIHWARTQGCAHVDAVARPGDRGTKRLLEAAGFKTRQLRMRLGEEPTAS